MPSQDYASQNVVGSNPGAGKDFSHKISVNHYLSAYLALQVSAL